MLGGFQHPGTLTLSSGVGGVGGAIGVPSTNSPDDLSGFQIDPKDFGIFGVRLYRSAAPLGLEHTVAYSPNFIDSDGNGLSLQYESAGWNCPHPYSGLTRQPVGVSFVREAAGLPASGRSSVLTMGAGLILEVMAPVGLRFDVRMYSIRGVEDHTLNVLESSIGIFVGF